MRGVTFSPIYARAPVRTTEIWNIHILYFLKAFLSGNQDYWRIFRIILVSLPVWRVDVSPFACIKLLLDYLRKQCTLQMYIKQLTIAFPFVLNYWKCPAENAVNGISEPLLKFEKFLKFSFCACARTPSNPHATPLKQVVSSFPSFRPPGKQPYFFFFFDFKNELLWVCQWKVLLLAKEKELKTRNKKYKLLTFGLRALFYAFNVCIRLWRSSWEYIWRQIR